MKLPLVLNGLNTSPGRPGTGFATGNRDPVVVEGALFDAVGFGFAPPDPDLCEVVRGVGVGGGSGRPGFVTSVFGAGATSRL